MYRDSPPPGLVRDSIRLTGAMVCYVLLCHAIQCFLATIVVESLLRKSLEAKRNARKAIFYKFYWRPSPVTTDPFGVSCHRRRVSTLSYLGKSRQVGGEQQS